MQTLHTVLKRGGLVWTQEDVPAALFPPRLARVQEAIAASGQDAWLVYGDAYRYGDLAYLSHFLPRVRGALLLVPGAGEPSLLVACGSRDIPAAKTLTWIDDVRPFTRLPGEAAKLLRERGLDQARIGLLGVEKQLAVGDWEQIQALLPDARWEPAGDRLAWLRARKDATELGVLRRAASIVNDGLAAAREALRPGLTERELWAVVDREMRRGAAEDVRCLIASGPRASVSLRPPDDRALERGDVVLLHLAAEYQRYWAESGQTLVLGTADEDERALADQAFRVVQTMMDGIGPGVTAGQIAQIAATTLVDVKAPGFVRTREAANAESYGLGHGIGLDLEEAPSIRPGGTDVLGEGSVVSLHAVLHGVGGRGAIAERTVAVTRGGAQALLDVVDGVLTWEYR
ncbi:MAG TPA: Xaa-Pro peptidase family protein [Chloroflexota bacterium]|jgi:Xaa-Pro dipeptidase